MLRHSAFRFQTVHSKFVVGIHISLDRTGGYFVGYGDLTALSSVAGKAVKNVSYKYYDDCAGFVVGYTQIYKQLLTSDLSFAIMNIAGER